MTETDQVDFAKKVKALLIEYGAVDREEYWELNTIYGKLQLTIAHTTVLLGTVFARFDEPGKASKLCSETGKWNFHYPPEVPVDDALKNFEYHLKKVITLKPNLIELILFVESFGNKEKAKTALLRQLDPLLVNHILDCLDTDGNCIFNITKR